MSRVYSQTSDEFGGRRAPTREPRANLVSRRPARIRSFLHIWSRPAPGNEYCNFVGDGNCFLSASLSKILWTSEMSTYFYRMCSIPRRAQYYVSICGITGMLEMSLNCVDMFAIDLKSISTYIHIYEYISFSQSKKQE